MLILRRKCGEGIVVDSNIVLTVLDVRRGRVLLGIDAPDEVSIHRQEVTLRIKEEGREEMPSETDSRVTRVGSRPEESVSN